MNTVVYNNITNILLIFKTFKKTFFKVSLLLSVVIVTGFLFYLFLIHLCIFVDLFTWSFVDLFCIFLFTCIFFTL